MRGASGKVQLLLAANDNSLLPHSKGWKQERFLRDIDAGFLFSNVQCLQKPKSPEVTVTINNFK